MRSELFLGQEIKSSIAHLEEAFGVHIKVLNNDKVPTRKANLPKDLQKIDEDTKCFSQSTGAFKFSDLESK